MVTQKLIVSDVNAEFGNKPPEQQAAATNAYNIGLDWVNSQPKTWCMSDERKSRLEQRREARQKKRQLTTKLYDHIYSQMVPDKHSVGDVQVVGFGFIAIAILSAIISWAVQRLLSHYFSE